MGAKCFLALLPLLLVSVQGKSEESQLDQDTNLDPLRRVLFADRLSL